MRTEAHQRIDQPIPWDNPELLPPVDREALYKNGEEIVLEDGDGIASPLIPKENIARDRNTNNIVVHVKPKDALTRLGKFPQSEQGQLMESLINVALSNTKTLVMYAKLERNNPQRLEFARGQFGLISGLVDQVKTLIGQNFVEETISLGKKIEEASSGSSRRQIS